MESIKFHVADMVWPSNAEAITAKLSRLDGVRTTSADCDSSEVTVLLAYPQSCECIYCAVEDMGYHIAGNGGLWFYV